MTLFQAVIEKEQLRDELENTRRRVEDHVSRIQKTIADETELVRQDSQRVRDQLETKVQMSFNTGNSYEDPLPLAPQSPLGLRLIPHGVCVCLWWSGQYYSIILSPGLLSFCCCKYPPPLSS